MKLQSICLLLILTTVFARSEYECNKDEFWNNYWCVPCSSNCKCTSEKGCDECLPGFVKVDSECKRCPQGCLKCNEFLDTCTTCDTENDYMLYERLGLCVKTTRQYEIFQVYQDILQLDNIPNSDWDYGECKFTDFEKFECNNCTNTETTIYYTTRDGTCKQCPNNCKVCSSQDQCTECQSGYQWNPIDNRCDSTCDTGCFQCFPGGFCKTCLEEGYYGEYDSDNQYEGRYNQYICKSCMDHCKTCQNNIYCEECSQGYYLQNDSSSCISCPQHSSQTCIKCINDQTCTECIEVNEDEEAYQIVLVSGKLVCVRCEDVFSNCEECANKNSSCVTCKDGFYLHDNQCKSCWSENNMYKHCDYDSINLRVYPTQCTSGRILWTDNNGFKQCASNEDCLTTIDSNANFACNKCIDGSVPKGNKCDECPWNCDKCSYDASEQYTCTTCIDGYEWNSTLRECVAIENDCQTVHSINNCVKCTVDVCTQCSSGFRLKNDKDAPTITNQCLQCESNCLSCNNDVCLECQENYYLKDGVCYRGLSFCRKQNEKHECEKCINGFRLEDGICKKCVSALGQWFCGQNSGFNNTYVQECVFGINSAVYLLPLTVILGMMILL